MVSLVSWFHGLIHGLMDVERFHDFIGFKVSWFHGDLEVQRFHGLIGFMVSWFNTWTDGCQEFS